MAQDNDSIIKNLKQEAQNCAEEISRYAPTTNSYGFLSFDTGGPPCCGGCGAFLWFENPQKCHEFIAEHSAFFAPTDDPVSSRDKLRTIVAQLAKGGLDLQEAIRLMNEALAGSSEITWIGPAEELCVGDSHFAIEVRSWYRDRMAEEEGDLDGEIVNTTKIADDQAERFLEALSEYGL